MSRLNYVAVICSGCGEFGHFSDQCHKIKKLKKPSVAKLTTTVHKNRIQWRLGRRITPTGATPLPSWIQDTPTGGNYE